MAVYNSGGSPPFPSLPSTKERNCFPASSLPKLHGTQNTKSMPAHVRQLSNLSLEDMPPMTRSKAKAASKTSSGQFLEGDESGADSASDYDASDIEDDLPGIVRSPTRLLYDINRLSDPKKAAIREVFDEPPKIAMQRCRRIGNTYAFQMTELVTRSIRIRAPDASDVAGSTQLSCSCETDGNSPCRHIVWFLDQLLKQTLYDYDESKPLHMNGHGYAEEMGDPFQNISDFHLDVLADALHCQVIGPEAYSSSGLDHYRCLEARELLSAVYSMAPEEYRPDIFDRPEPGVPVLGQKDLERTTYHMLLENHHFFQYFSSLCGPRDPINDPFRKLYQRLDHVLRDFDSYVSSSASSANSSFSSSPATVAATKIFNPEQPVPSNTTTPKDVTWASRHIVGIVKLIRSAIYSRNHPLQPDEASSAVRTLVKVLESVVRRNCDANNGESRRDRNLYLRLVGDRDRDFVLAELNLLPEAASHFVDSLEAILDEIGLQGAPATYVENFRKLIGRLRTSSSYGSLKRSGERCQASCRTSKRMK